MSQNKDWILAIIVFLIMYAIRSSKYYMGLTKTSVLHLYRKVSSMGLWKKYIQISTLLISFTLLFAYFSLILH